MAVADNNFISYAAVGRREDLTDVITRIDPVDTWFTSTTGTTSVNQTLHEWQTQALAAAAENAVAEGAAYTDAAVTATARLGNYTQILTKCFMVSRTLDAVNKAGRKSEIAYQTELKMKELSRDIEYALLINSASALGSAGSARKCKGAYGWISTNVTTGATAVTAEALTEAMLNDNLQLVWAAGGKPQHVVCGAFQKRKISAFTTNTRYMVADENKLASAVDVYQSDFGTVTVRLHHQVNTTIPSVLFVFGDMSLWQKGWLRGVKREQQPYAGDAELWSLTCELTLESRQEKGSGLIKELTTS